MQISVVPQSPISTNNPRMMVKLLSSTAHAGVILAAVGSLATSAPTLDTGTRLEVDLTLLQAAQ